MSRQARVVIPNVAHHVTQRGNYQQDVFFSDKDRRLYLSWLKEYSDRYSLEIWAYCLMSNHIHLIAVPHQADSLSRALAVTHIRYAQYINRKQKRSGHLWQGRFYSCPMDEPHLISAVRYVERNPVRAGMVARAQDWRWSSAKAHLREKKDKVLEGASWPPKDLVNQWEVILAETDEEFERAIRRQTRTGRPLGSKGFVERLEQITKRVLRKLPVGRSRKQ